MQIIEDAITSVFTNVIALYGSAGVRQFLIPNAPNLALAPAITLQGPQAQGLADFLSSAFNSALEDALVGKEALLPDV